MHTLFGDDISERHMGVKGAIEPELPSNDMGPPLPMMHIDQHFLDLDLMSVADLPDPSRLPASGQRHSYLLPSDLTGFMYAEPGADFSAIAQLQAEVRRMRRMLSNRESARRSRRRRQTQVSGLEEELDGVRAQVARLSAELERSNSIAQHAMMERAKAVSELEAMRAQFARTSVEAVSFQVQGHGEGPFALHDRCPMPERGAGGGIPRHSAPPLVSVASAPLPSLAQQGMQGMPSWQGKQDGLASCLDFLSR
ncbi:hypothetical protein APUTEX25_003131 [Auxenochlorella protothecoides]|uniref:BZIP domain-containing protein n=1 Tax=Auxenochlorella protothecoides TaxID=3075 RepID=A0A3M7KW26_AUXPR|nr:hypothetical protein APUTEX25_003131 [Auxenochlorella protothecoides]|eukprot:RMZ54753.1 hypothetical protein APUTEX25_003131 [Auxenochlorella protothecoides]